MVDPITDMAAANAAAKAAEGAASVGVEAAVSASESAATSAIKGIGEGSGMGNYGSIPGGTHIGVGNGMPNLNSGPMPEGFVANPVGGTQRGVGGGPIAGKTGAPQVVEKTPMQKLHEGMKIARNVERAYHATAQGGKDLMGNDAHRYDPVNKARPMESKASQWDKWTK